MIPILFLVLGAVVSADERRQERASSLRLRIRKDTDERDVDIRLTFNALGLVLWLAFGIILLYEILSILAILLRRNLCRHRQKHHAEEGTPAGEPPISLYILVLWGISTAYGIFYSFEMMFLYLNDRWYQLLGIQILFSATDIFVWCWMVGHVKYQFLGKSTLAAKACLLIKFNHLLFNICIERGIWSPRHWLFCLEDLTCLLLAKAVFGPSLKSLARPLMVSTLCTLAIVVFFLSGGRGRLT